MIDAPTATSATRSSAPRPLPLLLLLLGPVAVQALAVWRFGGDMLLWDEFVYVEALHAIGQDQPWWEWIWRQHNEHRIVWTKLLLFAHAGLTRWNPIVEMYVSAGMVGIIAWGIWRLYRAAGGERLAYFVPVAALLCSLAQYMNMLYGLMTCHYFSIAGMVWTIVWLMRGTWRSQIAAVLAAFAATVSTLNAIVIWPIGLVVLFLTRPARSRWIVWASAMAICGLAYFGHYDTPGPPPSPAASAALLRAIDASLMNLGAPLAAADVWSSRALGLTTAIVIGLLWAGIWRAGARETHAGLVALSLIAVSSALAVGALRSPLGPAAALESKYVGYSTLGLIASYLGMACLPVLRRRAVMTGFTAVLAIGLLSANIYGLRAATAWQKERRLTKYLTHTFEIQSNETLGAVYFPERVRESAAYLRATRMGPFRDRVDVLMPPRWRDATPTGALVRSAPLEAHLICPVDTLEDVGVLVAPAPGGRGAGAVHLAVKTGGAVAAEGRLETSTVTAPRYVRATLDPPLLACRGTDIVIQVSSDTDAPVSAMIGWTYPVYYPGVARQAGRVIEQRSLGVAFNAFSYGLLD